MLVQPTTILVMESMDYNPSEYSLDMDTYIRTEFCYIYDLVAFDEICGNLVSFIPMKSVTIGSRFAFLKRYTKKKINKVRLIEADYLNVLEGDNGIVLNVNGIASDNLFEMQMESI